MNNKRQDTEISNKANTCHYIHCCIGSPPTNKLYILYRSNTVFWIWHDLATQKALVKAQVSRPKRLHLGDWTRGVHRTRVEIISDFHHSLPRTTCGAVYVLRHLRPGLETSCEQSALRPEQGPESTVLGP